MVTPDAKRNAVAHARESYGLSERRACDLIGIARRVARYQPSRADDAGLRQRLRELAAERRRFGYRRLGYLLAREGLAPNHKKLLRIYREEGLKVRRRGGRKRALGTRTPMVLPQGPNQRWSLDFVSDALGCGKTHLIARALTRHSGPKPILVLTHTNAGVAALRGRLDRLQVPRASYRLATLDGWAMRLIATFPGRSGRARALPARRRALHALAVD
jgi:transposase InsO family protein